MAKEKVQEAVEVATAEVEVVEATEEIKEDIATTDETANTDEDALSPWYYFFANGCGWCKKAGPVVEELNSGGKHPEILMLDVAEPDNAKLRDELFAEYGTRCGTPWYINADTGKGICGFREKDVLEMWLDGKDIPEPPRPTGPPPKVPFQSSTNKENIAWKKEYKNWVKGNEHMPDDWKKRQKSVNELIDGPRPKSDMPTMPNVMQASDEALEKWGAELKVWQEENKHLPNLTPADQMIQNIKNRKAQMAQQQAGGAPGAPGVAAAPPVDNAKLNSMDARVQALEVKIDKIISHFGVK